MHTTTLIITSFFFFNDTATTEIYTLSLHDALPISFPPPCLAPPVTTGVSPLQRPCPTRTARNLRSEEHTSELQSLAYLVCRLLLEKKKELYKLGMHATRSLLRCSH